MAAVAHEFTVPADREAVVVTDLAKAYGGSDAFAIEDITFEVPQGQFLTLLGPSGCGKTTTLRCIAGLERATRGRIEMGGDVVFDASSKRDVKTEDRPIAMVPQSYGIWPHMTVLENAAFPMKYGRKRVKEKGDIRTRAMNVLEQVGLADFADRWSTRLSGGQQQRLALARALLCDPDVLLLDEPLSNLDAKLRVRLRGELRQFQQQFGVTSLYVTHDQAEALAMSDTVIVMNQGKVEQIDSPEALYNSPRTSFVADFIGSANLIPIEEGTAEASGVVVAKTSVGQFRCETVSTTTPGELTSGFVCARPENVMVLPVHDERALAEGGIHAKVTAAEFLGDRVAIDVAVGGLTLSSSMPGPLRVQPGDEVAVLIRPGDCLYLDR
ncbi:ABC transporter ATP-binding protein [Flexivirga alba]|uniref:ABC transporter ATP-binding protein n=1 Tax=Flexivirga alba TaxID=702742 RepID=A0ABW2ADH9_9MICO